MLPRVAPSYLSRLLRRLLLSMGFQFREFPIKSDAMRVDHVRHVILAQAVPFTNKGKTRDYLLRKGPLNVTDSRVLSTS